MPRPSSRTCRAASAAAPFVAAFLAVCQSPCPGADSSGTSIPTDFAAFQKEIAPLVLDKRPVDARHWRQIEPALHHLAVQHADRLTSMTPADRITALAALAGFIDQTRTAAAGTPVLAPGRTVIGLLDPDRGLEPREITAIVGAYGGTTTIFKKDEDGETLDTVADAFLAAVRTAVADAAPLTVVVLGHGLPTEIQSYHIRFERLADALIAGATVRGAPGGASPATVDLGRTVLICDDCFSADFLINLCEGITTRCRDQGLELASLPACVAGTNRNCVGHADVGAKFVPHFWKDVIELYFIRRPRPRQVTLRDFFENVDNMMYGYGRAPIVDGTKVSGYRLVDAELVQDPVVFVPLAAAELAALREILGLPADAPLARWLDAG
ncbi:MAG: hypothetical protein DWI03_07165 [Planctomycetota bacterium]|jgi:hypothetical protein|nr:MAG: hypothetical protein DWI03_07165 [Planctomycetota bacterium]